MIKPEFTIKMGKKDNSRQENNQKHVNRISLAFHKVKNEK